MQLQTLILILGVVLISCATRFLPARRLRLWVLLGASYLLYAHLAGVAFLGLLIASSLMNFSWGVALRRRPAGSLLWAAVGSNILLLGFFKYLPPLAEAWPGAFSQVDFFQRIVLPLGVSFWTFQALSYLIDIYLDEELDPSLTEFCLYMAFWPTVSSGPVCRMTKMLPQFRTLPAAFAEDFRIGAVRITQGLFMTFVLGQLLSAGVPNGTGVTAGFASTDVARSGLDVWALAIGYGFQLFFDFAGYSHIVIGAARLFGFRLEENFNRPYLSLSPAVFWTRWHMSLSFWIRDYVHLPLATLSRRQWWRYAVLVVSMLIFGFWHDARLTLLLWGLYHGLVLVGHRLGQRITPHIPVRLPSPVSVLLSWAATFLLMCLAYVLFRAESTAQALQMLSAVVTPASYALSQVTLSRDFFSLVIVLALGYFICVGLAELSMHSRGYVARLYRADVLRQIADGVAMRKWWILTPALGLLLLVTALRFFGERAGTTPFIYTQF